MVEDTLQMTEVEVAALESRATNARASIARAAAAVESEAAAPLRTDGALPLSVATLRNIPVDRQQQYARQMDGGFTLEWLHSDDAVSTITHNTAIAAGTVRVLPPGTTPASQLASAKARDARTALALGMAKTLTDARLAQQVSARNEAEAQLLANFRRQHGG